MGLKENLLHEKVKDLPLREPVTATPETLLPAVVERMREKHLGCAIVVDAEGKPLGTFTERGLIDLLLQESTAWESLPVGECLDRDCFTVPASASISEVLELICQRGVRFVCVTDEAGRVAGLTGQKGLSEYIADHYPRQVMVQRMGGKPGLVTREGA